MEKFAFGTQSGMVVLQSPKITCTACVSAHQSTRCWSYPTVLCAFLGDLLGRWDVVGEQKHGSTQLHTKPSDVQ